MPRGGGSLTTDREPVPEDVVAYLTGGPSQAVYAAVAALRSTGYDRAGWLAIGSVTSAGRKPKRA
jgi:hypothetical protein